MEKSFVVCTKEFINNVEFEEHERVCWRSPQTNEVVLNGK